MVGLFESEIHDIKIILRDVGTVLLGVGVLCLLPIIVALVYAEYMVIPSFILPAGLSILLGFLLRRSFFIEKETQLRHVMVISGLVWLLAAMIGSLPLLFTGVFSNFVDAYFESMSGWTTTGLTLISDVESLPKSILFWRSVQQYAGGVGFILLALTVLIGKGMPALKFYKTENMRMEVKPTITAMVKIILKVYFIYLIAGIVLYKVAGMPLFDAINHAMTTLACGGMSVKNAGIGFYNNPRVELASIILMILGVINMVLHYEIIKGNLKEVTKNIEVKVSVFVFFACLVVILNDRLLYAIYPTMKEVYRAGGYLVISAMSTTGFTIMSKAEIAGLTGFSTVFLIIIMVIGGGACSAAGGIKLLRLGIVAKAFYSKIKKLALPEEESTPTKIHYVEDVALDRGDLNMVFTFVALYIVIFITSGIIVSLLGYGVINAFFETASALGTVGLTCGITSITMPTIVKVVYIFDMWVGRLEILPALIMLLYIINKIKIATVGR